MRKVNCEMSMSVDGFVAGPNQALAATTGIWTGRAGGATSRPTTGRSSS
jgi:hypothetical protein